MAFSLKENHFYCALYLRTYMQDVLLKPCQYGLAAKRHFSVNACYILLLYTVIAIPMRTREKLHLCGHHNRLRAGTVSIYLFLQIIISFTEGSVFQFICSQRLFVGQASIFCEHY